MIIACPYCKKKLNQSATACPHCGRSRTAPQQPRAIAKTDISTAQVGALGCVLLVIVMGFIIIRGCANLMSTPTSPAEKKQEEQSDTRVALYQSACDSVRAGLKAPSTAHFSGIMETEFVIVPVTPEVAQRMNAIYGKHFPKGPVMMIFGWVDAENSFGAKLRSQWMGVAVKDGNSWRIDRVSVAQD